MCIVVDPRVKFIAVFNFLIVLGLTQSIIRMLQAARNTELLFIPKKTLVHGSVDESYPSQSLD